MTFISAGSHRHICHLMITAWHDCVKSGFHDGLWSLVNLEHRRLFFGKGCSQIQLWWLKYCHKVMNSGLVDEISASLEVHFPDLSNIVFRKRSEIRTPEENGVYWFISTRWANQQSLHYMFLTSSLHIPRQCQIMPVMF